MAESAVIPPLTGWHEDAPTHPYYVCDVFTSTPLEGNQLGVFVDGRRERSRSPEAARGWARRSGGLAALGVRASSLPVELYRIGPTHAFVRLDSEEEVAALAPDMRALAGLGVAANCFAGAGARYKTRMFCPAAGVAEDAATGSAAGPLAIHLARHGQIAYGEEIEIRQGAEIGRPSVLYARASGEGERIESVEVGGVAVVVAEGRYRVARG